MTALALWVFILMYSGALVFLGYRAGNADRRLSAKSVAPKELPVHLETLREVLAATGDLTPEAEAWIASAVTQVSGQKALQAPLNDRWEDFKQEWNASTEFAEEALDLLKQYAPSISWSIKRKTSVVAALRESEDRTRARKIIDKAWTGAPSRKSS